MEIYLQASAGVLAIATSFFNGEENQRHKKIAEWLYHAAVGMMTGVVFCDVIKMTFGLDPALSEQDYLGNRTSNLYDIFMKGSKQETILKSITVPFFLVLITLPIVLVSWYVKFYQKSKLNLVEYNLLQPLIYVKVNGLLYSQYVLNKMHYYDREYFFYHWKL